MLGSDKIEIHPAALKSCGLFAGLSDSQLEELIACLRLEKWPRGGRIVTAGEWSDALHVIYRGGVDILRQVVTREGEGEEKIAALREGNTFGEMALVDRQPCTASVVANTDSVIFTLEHADLPKLDPRIYAAMLVNLTREANRRLRSLDQHFAVSLFSNLEQTRFRPLSKV